MKEEATFQKSLVKWFRENYPDYIIFSVPNEATYPYSNRYKATGLLIGAPDLVMVLPRHIIFIECKRADGKQKDEQIAFQRKCNQLNHEYYIVRDIQDVRAILREHLYIDEWHDL